MEALGCSNIIRKLTIFYPPSLFASLPEDLFKEYLNQVTELTCHFMKAAAHKNSVSLGQNTFPNIC